jgi:M6 family metalloprotease-like protein
MVFDPHKTYRLPIVLVAFSDVDFTMPDPKSYYEQVFNEQGYNEGVGLGCMADYFRDQSGGRLNFQFDVYGPYKVSQTAGGHGKGYYGTDVMTAAVKLLNETESTDFAIYDWDGDGEVNQVFFVAAGFGGNLVAGYVWPNSQTLDVKLPGDRPPHFCSIANELWKDGSLNGFATVAHEIGHGLGLPDIYPLGSATAFSAVDEWDLLDGGNYTNKGWCPPNFSVMEKMYLGWDQPEELIESTTITGMQPVSKGGQTYLIRCSDNDDEYWLLENRQQEGWDYGSPGKGLLVIHVDYAASSWKNNEVNISDTHYRYDLSHADGKDYLDWDPANNGQDPNKWTLPNCLRNVYLSTSPYPYEDNRSVAINSTDLISNITQAADGTVSFDLIRDASAIRTPSAEAVPVAYYDLQGRLLPGLPYNPGIYIIQYADGTTRKCIR